MNHLKTESEFEKKVIALNNEEMLRCEKSRYDGYRVSILPRILAGFLVHGGTLVYGANPSYLKFRAVEVIARVPYHSWQAVGFILMTLFYKDERRALRLAQMEDFTRIAQDNETMHVVVISALAKQEEKSRVIHDTFVPLLFAGVYFFILHFFLVCKRWSFELNYLFEQHAFDQYQIFLQTRGEVLKKKSVDSPFLRWYGREPRNQYEFFVSVRNDEMVHRNRSIEAIEALREE